MEHANLPKDCTCPVSCPHYGNDTGTEDEYFIEWCSLSSDILVEKCPLTGKPTREVKDGKK